MKKIIFLVLSLIFTIGITFAQTSKKTKRLPSMTIKDVDGKEIRTSELSNNGKPIIISFWATWCTPCKKELNTINEEYEDWVDETGVKLIAVSIDDARTATRVKPYINGMGWEYDIWMDTNGDFKRAMGVNNVPHTFIIDGEGNIVYSHNNYAPGDEEKLYEKIVSLSKK